MVEIKTASVESIQITAYPLHSSKNNPGCFSILLDSAVDHFSEMTYDIPS